MTEKQVIREAMSRYAIIETGNGSRGSGVVIYTGFVLTCFHILDAGCGIRINGRKAKIVAADPKNDLVLLSVKTKKVAMVKFGTVDLGETVVFVGNPSGASGVLMFGRVGYVNTQKILHDGHGGPGISGSGLFNQKSQMVGINSKVRGDKHIGNWLTEAVPAKKLKKVLSGC
jgi:S1-C subfamily serine protease